MWKTIGLFEVQYQLRRPLFYLITGLFSLLVFTWATGDALGDAVGPIHLNAPVVTLEMLTRGNLLGLFAVAAFVATAALRDFHHGTLDVLLSKPISRVDYLGGRFAGGVALAALMYAVVTTTLAVSTFMPWLDPERLGPFLPSPYLFTLGVLVLPNVFFLGATFFALATWSRSAIATCVGVIAFVVASQIASGVPHDTVAQLLDPFGLDALVAAIDYWTVAERNSGVPAVEGTLLYNRILWVGVGAAFLGSCLLTAAPSRPRSPGRRRREDGPAASIGPVPVRWPSARRVFSRGAVAAQFFRQTRLEVAAVVTSLPFLVVLGLGLLNMVAGADSVDRQLGTGVYPHTSLMVQLLQQKHALLLVLVAMFYAGELVWRERSLGVSEIYDAAPTPNGVHLGAKLTALLTITILFLALGAVATLGFQLWSGHYQLELGLYAQGIAVASAYFLFNAVLACFLQVVAPSKFVGYALMLGYLLSWDMLEELDFQHHLFRFGSVPPTPYSDMNGYGHFLTPLSWYASYWACACVVLIGLSIAFWRRGTDASWKSRWSRARTRLRGPVRGLVVAGGLGFIAIGSWIYYDTRVLYPSSSAASVEARRAAYEKRYRQYEDAAVPRLTEVRAEVDLIPERRRAEIRGHYRLRNDGTAPIRELHLTLPDHVRVERLELPAHRPRIEDDELGYRVYELDAPLRPQETMELGFAMVVAPRGLAPHASDTSVVGNGTFLDSRDDFPTLGYRRRRELTDPETRRAHGLEPDRRIAEVDDPLGRAHVYPLGGGAGLVDFEVTVSTDPDQIAVAPGELRASWVEDGRRHFRYETDAPMLPIFGVMSARYEVVRDRWNGVDIEVYYHPQHAYNVDRMVDSMKKSLDYFTASFSPYQFRHLRIVEVPRYVDFGALAYPGTIAFSERAGFLSRVEEGAFDVPFRRTSHEVAHMWWGHQVLGGDVRGAAMLTETMAQYSALMVMRRELGPEVVRRYLGEELDRYLRNRGRERYVEAPLSRTDNQPYVHYNKGSVVMDALRHHLGEDRLNRALSRYISEVAFQGPPFTTADELLAELRRAAPESASGMIEDLFDRIVLFDNRVIEAECTERADGTFLVRLEAVLRKLRADGTGQESEVPIDDWVDIAVFGQADDHGEGRETLLALERRHVDEPRPALELVVNARPARAGIDPYHRLIDRNVDDNLMACATAE